jgi:hypothetical protein
MMQELNREANTLGSKAAAKLADASMELKLLIEQMREQVQKTWSNRDETIPMLTTFAAPEGRPGGGCRDRSHRDGHASHALHGGVIPATCSWSSRRRRRQVDAGQRAAGAGQRHLPVDLVHHAQAAPGRAGRPQYHFTTVEDFRARTPRRIPRKREVHGNYYGTSRVWIEEQMASSRDVLLEIDWQGAQQVKQQFPTRSASSSCRRRSTRWSA